MAQPPDGPDRSDQPLVLLVEDNPAIRDLVRQFLEGHGLRVETAGDDRQALACLARFRPAVVLLDLELRIGSARELAAAVHAAFDSTVPILLVTGSPRPVAESRAIRASAYLTKPFDLDDLLSRVRQLLARP